MWIFVVIILFFLLFIRTTMEMSKLFSTRQSVGAPFYKETFD